MDVERQVPPIVRPLSAVFSSSTRTARSHGARESLIPMTARLTARMTHGRMSRMKPGKSIPGTARPCLRTDKCHRYCFESPLWLRLRTEGRSWHARAREGQVSVPEASAAIRKDMGKQAGKTARGNDTESFALQFAQPFAHPSAMTVVQPLTRSAARSLSRSAVHPAGKPENQPTSSAGKPAGEHAARHDSARERCERM